MKRFLTAIALLCLSASSISAAEIKRITSEDGSTVISISGRLVDGDDRRFSLLTYKANEAIVILNSEGGRTIPALSIGRLIRKKGYWTRVEPLQTCASACGLIWLAGKTRMAYPSSFVGFHSVFTFEPEGPKISQYGNSLVGRYLRDLGFSDDVVAYATAEPPDSMKWINARDAMHLGVSIDLRPE